MLVLPLQGKRTHSLLIIGFVIFETEKRKGRGGEGREGKNGAQAASGVGTTAVGTRERKGRIPALLLSPRQIPG